MEYVLLFLAGLLCGVILTTVVKRARTHTDGNLRIERSDPDGPYLFLELYNAVDTVSGKKQVLFDVVDKNYISRK